jgi:hypothetical protein
MAIDVEVRPAPHSTHDSPYWRAIVTTARGLCYFVIYAGDKPSEKTVRQAWRDDRRAFDPLIA